MQHVLKPLHRCFTRILGQLNVISALSSLPRRTRRHYYYSLYLQQMARNNHPQSSIPFRLVYNIFIFLFLSFAVFLSFQQVFNTIINQQYYLIDYFFYLFAFIQRWLKRNFWTRGVVNTKMNSKKVFFETHIMLKKIKDENLISLMNIRLW